MVKYYDAFGEPTGNKKSAFVKASDYTSLEAEVSRLTALVDEAKRMAAPLGRLPSFLDDLTEWDDDAQIHLKNGSLIINSIILGDLRAARAFAEKAGA